MLATTKSQPDTVMPAATNPQHGVARWNAKLDADDVRLIRALVDEREKLLSAAKQLTDKAIAAKFDVHPHTIWKACKRETWIRA